MNTPESSLLQQMLQESRYEEAAQLARESIATCPAEFGEDSVREADLLDALVQALYRGGHAMESEGLEAAERAIAIKELRLGADSSGMATSLMQMGNLLLFRREGGKALVRYQQAIAILEVIDPDEEPGTEQQLAILYSNAAILLRRSGDYDESLAMAYRALEIRERVLGDSHPDLAGSLNNIANILIQQGDYENARQHHERALDIRASHYGGEHELVAESANNLANVLGYLGEYDHALSNQIRAVRILEKILGPEHDRTWTTQTNLAILEADMGNHRDSQRTCEQVLERQETRFGADSLETVSTRDALAAALRAQGYVQRAAELYSQSLAVYEKHYGVGTDIALYTMQGLGECLTELGELDRARDVLNRTLVIWKESLGDDSPEICELLHALARLNLATGDFDQTIAFANQSLEIINSSIGLDHPLSADANFLLATAAARSGDKEFALDRALQAEAISRGHLRETMRVLNESLALDYAATRVNSRDLALSLLGERNEGEAVAKVWDALIRSRSIVLEEMAARRRATRDHDNPEVERELARSRRARERLANLTLRGPGWEEISTYRQLMDSAREDIKQADRAIALATGSTRENDSMESVGFTQMQSALQPGEALVAYVRHEKPTWEASEDSTDVYRAFVAVGGDRPPFSIELDPASQIDLRAMEWHADVGSGVSGNSRGFTRVSRDVDTRMSSHRDISRDLRRSIWDPVRRLLDDPIRSFYVVCDGQLNLVNFDALVEDDGSFLIDHEATIWPLTVERSLCETEAERPESSSLLLIGHPAFDVSLSDPGPDAEAQGPWAGCLEGMRTTTGTGFPSLPGTQTEIENIARIWANTYGEEARVSLLRGADATEEAFKELAPQHGIIHVATHGFYASDCSNRSEFRRNQALVLSGLAFAGANHWSENRRMESDGLVTAMEVAAMDLSGADWVLMSACDTGLGQIQGRSEGVFGLRRAMQIAGARSVVMSLWSVDDQIGQQWMSDLYHARLEHGLSKREAFRAASRARLQALRDQDLPTHPRNWAPFVAVGDWR